MWQIIKIQQTNKHTIDLTGTSINISGRYTSRYIWKLLTTTIFLKRSTPVNCESTVLPLPQLFCHLVRTRSEDFQIVVDLQSIHPQPARVWCITYSGSASFQAVIPTTSVTSASLLWQDNSAPCSNHAVNRTLQVPRHSTCINVDLVSCKRIRRMICTRLPAKFYSYYSASIGERSIAISLSVCLSVREHTSGTAGPILTNFFVRLFCGCGSVPLTLGYRGGVWCLNALFRYFSYYISVTLAVKVMMYFYS